jgi:hypothetical protein
MYFTKHTTVCLLFFSQHFSHENLASAQKKVDYNYCYIKFIEILRVVCEH